MLVLMDIKLNRFELHHEAIELLKLQWTELEKLSDNVSFFTSWNWIGTWLETMNGKAWLVRVMEMDQIIGLGILVEQYNGFWPFSHKNFFLNKTGRAKQDQIWIEYNDFVFANTVTEQQKYQIRQLLINQDVVRVQEIHFDLVDHLPHCANVRFKTAVTGYLKHLVVNGQTQDLQSQFSKNTRQQLNRSIRLLKQQNELVLQAAEQNNEGNGFMSEIGQRHRDQWGQSEWGSGFENWSFVRFHQKLSKKGCIRQLKLSLNREALAYGYYFLFRDKVYFYLSAIEKHPDKRIKVGLVFHFYAMKYFQNEGFKAYDFLGGDARYKQSLSDKSYQLYSWYITRNNVMSKLKDVYLALRSISRQHKVSKTD